MATGTKNYFVGPEDGWTLLVTGTPAITLLRVQSYPVESPFYLHIGSAPPALPQTGIMITDDEFWLTGSEAQNVYVKVTRPHYAQSTGDKLRIDVYTQGGALS